MRTSIICATVLLSLTTNRLRAGENSPPPMAPGAAWTVDKSRTVVYPDWLRIWNNLRPELRNVLTSEMGNLQYWIRVPKGARGTIAVAVGEAHWAEPGHRLMDILIDGRVRASRIDPIAAAGGQNRLAVIACEAEDLDGDGLLHVQIVASKGSPDHVTLDAGLWWFAGKTVSAKEAAKLPRLDCTLKPDLFIGHGFDVSPWKERFAGRIRTEDPKLNAMIESVYDRCVWGALRAPRPPALPCRWFHGGGGYLGQWIWDAMFVSTAFAPLDDDRTIRDVFENYWHMHRPQPRGAQGIVPLRHGPLLPQPFVLAARGLLANSDSRLGLPDGLPSDQRPRAGRTLPAVPGDLRPVVFVGAGRGRQRTDRVRRLQARRGRLGHDPDRPLRELRLSSAPGRLETDSASQAARRRRMVRQHGRRGANLLPADERRGDRRPGGGDRQEGAGREVSADRRPADQSGAREDVGPEDAVLLQPRPRQLRRRFPGGRSKASSR